MRNALITALALFATAPALADVKAGVDAWQRGDYRQAVEEWRGAAVAGDADAQFNLGQAYKLGRGVPVDPQMAESWFGKAARQGHRQAEDNYALALFQAGRKTEAVPWLEKSVARDEPRTELVLGTMLFNGDGAPRDVVRAYALMTRAAAARSGTEGLASARETLAQMDDYMLPQERERGIAMAQRIALVATAEPAASGSTRVTEAPPRPGAMQTADAPPAHTPPPRAKPPAPPRIMRTAAMPPPARSVPAPGAFRIQLGAFRDRGNAEALWSRVGRRLPGARPSYVTAAEVTRLQATGFATRASAQAACTRIGGGCIVVTP